MARPIKTGLDYFPLDVDMDEKIELIEAKHGLLGFGLVIKLFQKIYKNGYFFNVTEDKILLAKKQLNVDINFINECINDSCRWDIFHEGLFEQYKILTSNGIQKRFIEATKRRTEISFIKEYMLVSDVEGFYKDGVIVNINSINADSSTQSKGKKSKGKNKKSKKKQFSPPTKKETEDYFIGNGYTKKSGGQAWEYYVAGDWKDARGNQVKNWKQKMRGVWFKDENKINNNEYQAPRKTIAERKAEENELFANTTPTTR